MEVLIDLHEYLGSQHIILASHLSFHFLIAHVTIGESQSRLGVWLGVHLVPVERYETGVR